MKAIVEQIILPEEKINSKEQDCEGYSQKSK